MNKLLINEDDPVYVTRHKIEMMALSLKKGKYGIILNFMNDLFCKEHKSLTSFKYINIGNCNINDMKSVAKSHKKKLKETFKLEIEEDEVCEKYIATFLRKALSCIDYSFHKRQDTGTYYVKN